jgi:transposase
LGEEGVKNLKKKSAECTAACNPDLKSGLVGGQEHPRGKKPLLKEEQFQELKEQLKKRPPDGGLWTGPKVARWIEKITGIEKVWNQRGWDYLKKSKYSWQKPRPKHKKGELIE